MQRPSRNDERIVTELLKALYNLLQTRPVKQPPRNLQKAHLLELPYAVPHDGLHEKLFYVGQLTKAFRELAPRLIDGDASFRHLRLEDENELLLQCNGGLDFAQAVEAREVPS